MIINPFKTEYQQYLQIDLNKIPKEIVDLSINRVMKFKKNLDYYINLEEKEDIVSFFLLCQSLALSPISQKSFHAVTILKQTIQKRLEINPDISDMKDLIDIEPSDLGGEDAYRLRSLKNAPAEFMLNWYEVYDVIDPISEYIFNGKVYVSKYELVTIYGDLLGKKTYKYIQSISDAIKKADHPLHKKIFNSIKFYSAPIKTTEKLSSNKFPPCINAAFNGVSSGTRNYAVTVLLTSFLSYARIFPSTRIFDRNYNVELQEKEIEVILKEIVPMILEAGSRCDPPLFKDQPIEKENVFYHLGFGLTTSPSMNDFGRSKWYLPPNCSKIRENAPSLCHPDNFCRKKFYQIADKEKASNLIKAAEKRNKKSLGEKLLEELEKYDIIEKLSSQLDISEKEIEKQLDILTKNKIVGYRGITNPLIHYIRRKRLP